MKIKLPSKLVNFALGFIDAEASGDVAVYKSRIYEYSFALSKFATKTPGRLLDVGCISSTNIIIPTACELGYKVVGVDIRSPHLYTHPNYIFIQSDVRDLGLRKYYDVITCISTIEHIGSAGRYGIKEESKYGDLEALDKFMELLEENGILILTFPYSNFPIKSKLNKVYSKDFIEKLRTDWNFLDERYLDVKEEEKVALLELKKI